MWADSLRVHHGGEGMVAGTGDCGSHCICIQNVEGRQETGPDYKAQRSTFSGLLSPNKALHPEDSVTFIVLPAADSI